MNGDEKAGCSEKSCSNALGEPLQIEEGKEVDRLEFPVNGRWSAHARGNLEVSTEQPGNIRWRERQTVCLAFVPGYWRGAQGRLNPFPSQRFIERHSGIFILRREGTAANQKAGIASRGVFGDALPKEVQHVGVSIMVVDAGPAQFENFAADGFERTEIEELLAVIAKVSHRAVAALHAVCSDEGLRGRVEDHQVVTDEIIGIAITARAGGAVQPLTQFAVENLVTQTLTLLKVFYGLC